MVNFIKKTIKIVQKKEIIPTALIDIGTWLVIYFAFITATARINAWFTRILGGRTPQDFQQAIQNNPLELAPLVNELKLFAIVALMGIIIFFIATVLFYVFSRKFLWEFLSKTKQKLSSWCLLHLVLIFPLLGLGILLLIGRIITSFVSLALIKFIFQPRIQNLEIIAEVVNTLASFVFILIFFIFTFIVYYHMTKKKKMWVTVGEGFSALFRQWKKTLQTVGVGMLFAVIIALINLGFKRIIFNGTAQIIIAIILSGFLFAFLRLVTIEILTNGYHKVHKK